jgi:hypothetical protein
MLSKLSSFLGVDVSQLKYSQKSIRACIQTVEIISPPFSSQMRMVQFFIHHPPATVFRRPAVSLVEQFGLD